jgi:hypothetical protein
MMQPPPPAKQPSETNVRGIYTSENVSLEVPFTGHDGRPPPVKYTCACPPPSLMSRPHCSFRASVPSPPTTPRSDTTSEQRPRPDE